MTTLVATEPNNEKENVVKRDLIKTFFKISCMKLQLVRNDIY